MSRRKRRRGEVPPARPCASPASDSGHRLRRVAVFLASTVAVAVIGAVSARVVNSYHPSRPKPQGPAIKASVDVDMYSTSGMEIIVPGPVRREQIPHTYAAARQWALSRGGVETATYLDVTLEGQRSPAVVIRQIRATVTSRQPALRGSLLRFPGSEGSAETVNIAFDLSDAVPVAKRAEPDARPRVPYFAGRYLTLALGEQIVLKVEAWPGTDLCTWRLDLDTVVGAVPQTILLPGDDQSFRTTPPQPSYQAAYQIGPGDRVRVAPSGQ